MEEKQVEQDVFFRFLQTPTYGSVPACSSLSKRKPHMFKLGALDQGSLRCLADSVQWMKLWRL